MTDALLGSSRAERLAVLALAAVTLALLAALPAWRLDDRPAANAYAEEPAAFLARVEDFAARHATGRMAEGGELVAPPPGDVPLLARRFEFWPPLELEAGRTYRLHVASTDTVHSVAVDGREVLLVPGETRVLAVTPAVPGRLPLLCNEYCGLGHNRMRGMVVVRPAGAESAPP